MYQLFQLLQYWRILMVQILVAMDQEDQGSSDQRVDELLVAHLVVAMAALVTNPADEMMAG